MKSENAATNWSLDLSLCIVTAMSALIWALAGGPGIKSGLLISAANLLFLLATIYAIVRGVARFSSNTRRASFVSLLSLIIVGPVLVDAAHFGFFRAHLDGLGMAIALQALSGGEVLMNTWGGLWFLLIFLGWVVGCWIVGLSLNAREKRVERLGRKTWILRGSCLVFSLFMLSRLPRDATEVSGNYVAPTHDRIGDNRNANEAGLNFDVMTERQSLRDLHARLLALNPEDLKSEKKPNILLIHIESLRWDMLTPELMPRITAWLKKRTQREQCIVPEYQFSTGNNSGTGVFGIMSGLPGFYYHVFRKVREPPLGLNLLTKMGYRFHFFASMSWEFDDLYYNFIEPFDKHSLRLSVPKSIDLWRADQELFRRYKEILQSSDRNSPRFDYVAWNSTHYYYYYPSTFEKFLPVMDGGEELTPLALARIRRKPFLAKNRYLNAVLFADHEIGELLESLENSGDLGNTVVVLFGDHGEEFFEQGRFAHTFGFSNEQTRVMTALCFPTAVKSEYKFASHHDIIPTLMDYIGARDSIRSLLGGKSLLGAKVTPDFSLTSMSSLVSQMSLAHMVIGDRYKVQFVNRGEGTPLKVYDLNDNELPDYDRTMVHELLRFALEAKTLKGARPQ